MNLIKKLKNKMGNDEDKPAPAPETVAKAEYDKLKAELEALKVLKASPPQTKKKEKEEPPVVDDKDNVLKAELEALKKEFTDFKASVPAKVGNKPQGFKPTKFIF